MQGTDSVVNADPATGSQSTPRSGVRVLFGILLLTALYYLTARFGLLLQLPGTNSSPVWPPSGIALAALIFFGPRIWPGVLFGALLANLHTLPHTLEGTIAALGICLGNTGEQIVAVLLIRKYIPSLDLGGNPRDVLLFLLIAIGSTLIAATNGLIWLFFTGIVSLALVPEAWYTWWLGDLAGILILTPFLVAWSRKPLLALSQARRLELMLLLFLSGTTVQLLFGGFINTVLTQLPFIFMLPWLLWAAFRFGPRETWTVTLILSVISISKTWWSMSVVDGATPHTMVVPFLNPSLTPNESLLMLQFFLCAKVATASMVAAIVYQRRTAEEALRKSEQREKERANELQTIMESVPAIIWIARDPEGQVITGNTASYEFLRIPKPNNASLSAPESVRPNHFVVLSGGRQLEPFELPVQRAARGEVLRNFEEEVRFEDGTSHYLIGNASPLRDGDNRVIGAVSAFVEITERKEYERKIENLNRELEERVRARTAELEHVNRELEAFNYSIAHDLRAPLRAINGFASMIREDLGPSLSTDVDKNLEIIAHNARLMGRLVDGLLDFSRLGRRSLRKETLAPDALLRSILAEDLQLVIPSSVRITIHALPKVYADPVLFPQVLVNLLSNAVKFSSRHKMPEIEVGAFAQGTEWVIFVRDNGVGFNMDHSEKLFGIFQRLHNDADFEGTGIGLAVTKRIIERHGGRIWAESTPGKGSTFFFTIPPP